MLKTLCLFGKEAISLDGNIETSCSNEDDASKIVMKLSDDILDGKIRSLRINLPHKIVFVSAQDNQHLLFRAETISNNNTAN